MLKPPWGTFTNRNPVQFESVHRNPGQCDALLPSAGSVRPLMGVGAVQERVAAGGGATTKSHQGGAWARRLWDHGGGIATAAKHASSQQPGFPPAETQGRHRAGAGGYGDLLVPPPSGHRSGHGVPPASAPHAVLIGLKGETVY